MPRLACIAKNEKAPDCVDSNAAKGVSRNYFYYIFPLELTGIIIPEYI